MGKNYFRGKTIWITGSTSGIGKALVMSLAQRGSKLIISSNSADELNGVKSECLLLGVDVITVPFDLQEADSIADVAKEVLEKAGAIDMLFNIGGISQRSLIEHTSLDIDRKIMEINFFGSIALTKALLPHMISRGSGHIIATSSISGRFGFPLRSAYSASKQALHGFYETLRIETAERGIKVSILIPGRVRTNISLNALDASGNPHNKMDKGQDKGITPEKAAKQVLRGIERGKFEILVGGFELIMLYIRKFLPGVFFRLAGRISAV